MALRLLYKGETTVPVEIEGLTPDALCAQPLEEIKRLEIFEGNRRRTLGEMFEVTGDASDLRWDLEGNLAGVHWIGAHMREGEIHIHGDGGRHIGSEMYGGAIHVHGTAGDWVGGVMHGGLIHVRGNAGHLIGAAYRGSAKGMTGGTILIGGDCGNEIGHTMRRGWIAVRGRCADMAGFNMIAGSIFAFGGCGIRPGAGMRRGTIAVLGGELPQLLPSFRYACRYRPIFLRLMLRQLQQLGFEMPADLSAAEVDLYAGDLVALGKGEIILRAGDAAA